MGLERVLGGSCFPLAAKTADRKCSAFMSYPKMLNSCRRGSLGPWFGADGSDTCWVSSVSSCDAE